MKKFLAMILCAIMVCAVATNAMAATISGTLTSTKTFKNVTTTVAIEGSDWTASFTGASSTQRVVARVHAGYDAASASWVFSGYSTTPHDYKPEYMYTSELITLRARIDTRDVGPITISGVFTP